MGSSSWAVSPAGWGLGWFPGTIPSIAKEALKQQLLVDKARIVVDKFAADANLESFRTYLKLAKAVLIVPELYKAAWFIGGSGGRGALMVRNREAGEWIGPTFYTTSSVSFGVQIGGEKSEVVILVMTQKGVNSLYAESIKLGGEVSVAAGPIGAGIQGAAAPGFSVDYITFSLSKGAFLGLSLDGAVISENSDGNAAYYEKALKSEEIIKKGVINPNSNKLREALGNASRIVQ